MNTIHTHYFKSPYGELILGDYDGELCLCDWRYRKAREKVDQRVKSGLKAEFKEKQTPLLIETQKQLEAFFNRERSDFDLPLTLVGSEFQKTVWETLMQVPYGETQSYLQLATTLNNIPAIRAVASANGANALAIVIPCHRIIAQNGDLTGYAGGISTKKKLLELEGALNTNQISLF